MGEHVYDEETRKRATRPWTRFYHGTDLLHRMGVIKEDVDASKYAFAVEEVSKFMSEHGLRYVSKLITPLSTYGVFVVSHVHFQGSEDDYAKVIAMTKKWSDYRVLSFPRLVLENEELLNKLGVPLSYFLHLLSGTEGRLRVVADSEKRVEVAGGAQVQVAGASAKVEKVEKQLTEKEVQTNIETVRVALGFVFENIKKPVVLIADVSEVELIGANTILKATVTNKNLAVLVYGTGGNEVEKLMESGRATRFVSGFPTPVVKSELINMCMAMSRELSPKLFNVGGRKGTRAGLSATVKLLAEADVLGKAAGYIVRRFDDPYVAFKTMSIFIAKMYARFVRSPESVLEAYSKYNSQVKRAFSYALMREALKTLHSLSLF